MFQRRDAQSSERVNARCLGGLDGVHAHNVVGVTGEQGGTIGRPGKRNALDGDGLLAGGGELGLELIDAEARLEVPEMKQTKSKQYSDEKMHSEPQTEPSIVWEQPLSNVCVCVVKLTRS